MSYERATEPRAVDAGESQCATRDAVRTAGTWAGEQI
jgi:hypothetical protein